MERRVITVQGIVQGVGFRPFVYGLATRLGLGGFVRNQSGSVLIEVEGPAGGVERFVEELRTRPPPLAKIDSVHSSSTALRGQKQFEIVQSETDATAADVCISPDIAVCDQCVAEMFDPTDRRYRYPFINCTNCGPRLTIIKGTPYDRPRTTMAGFEMCTQCRAEYDNPMDRRFHAQPIACEKCGPSLTLLDDTGRRAIGEEPLAKAVAALRDGKIVAIKGLGGFHLACDARNESAVRELRRRKARDEKPFALMVQNSSHAAALCHFDQNERELLEGRARPIVLMRRRDGIDLASGVAPGGNPFLGLMLPYTPLHHLLMHDLAGEVLVMTSGNRSDEPIAYEDEDALARLRGIADLFLMNNRPIHVRCDDSVTRVMRGKEAPIRRSRGYAPQPVALPVKCPEPILAVGGQLKGTFALGRESRAILSHHLGDLDELSAYRAFERDIQLYQNSFSIRPRVIAHDLHPDYASTRYAMRRSSDQNIPRIAVQHHHAHMASCMAEHGLDEPVIGVCFDGTGYGTDGAIWGGEFLVGHLAEFERAAHLRYVPMPGAEKAIKEPWRMAISYLTDADVECPPYLLRRLNAAALKTTHKAIERRLNAPMTSSAGRLFDAVASICGLRDTVEFEGQAAMELEWRAGENIVMPVYVWEMIEDANNALQIDLRPMIRQIAFDVRNDQSVAAISARFHATLIEIISDVCVRLRDRAKIHKVVLSGGVFMNALLSGTVEDKLTSKGFCVFRHRVVPANDGGISLGQLAAAAKRLSPDGAGQ